MPHLLPRISVKRLSDTVNVMIAFANVLVTSTADERGVSVHVDQRNTNRFVELYVDKPTGEVCFRVSYKR